MARAPYAYNRDFREEERERRVQADARAERLKKGVLPVERWEAGDGKTFATHEEARQHQAFLEVLPALGPWTEAGYESGAAGMLYLAIKAVSAKFDFVPREAK